MQVANNTKAIKILEKRVLSPKSILYLVKVENKKVLISESHMEVRAITNETVQDKIVELEDEARLAIKKAEEKGLIPILALSYLEFGKTLRHDEPIQTLIYFIYCRTTTWAYKGW